MVYSETIDGDAISAIRLALHSGQHDAALERITVELAAAQKQRRHYRVLKLTVLEVIAHHRRGSDKLARRSLRRVLQLAAPENFVRVLLDDGALLLPLLHEEHASLAPEIADGATALLALPALVAPLLRARCHAVPPD